QLKSPLTWLGVTFVTFAFFVVSLSIYNQSFEHGGGILGKIAARSGHRRRWIPRLASLRCLAGRGPRGGLRGQSAHRPAAESGASEERIPFPVSSVRYLPAL